MFGKIHLGNSEIKGTHSLVRRLTSSLHWWSIYSYDSSMIAELHQGNLKAKQTWCPHFAIGMRPEVLVFESVRSLYLRRFFCEQNLLITHMLSSMQLAQASKARYIRLLLVDDWSCFTSTSKWSRLGNERKQRTIHCSRWSSSFGHPGGCVTALRVLRQTNVLFLPPPTTT